MTALAIGLLALLGGGADDPPRAARPASRGFVDVTAASGVAFVHDAGLAPEKPLPETMGAGGALLDADEDGDLDLYLVQGGPLMPAARAAAESLPRNRLFANDGRGRFTDVTAESGDAAHPGYGMGCAVGDATGDGHADLYVTNLGPDVLLAGDGNARFADVTARAGIADERWTAGAVFFDPDADGDLDLYVTGYLAIDLTDLPWCGDRKPGWRSACHPDRFEGISDRYWRNQGDGTFEDATAAAGFADSTGKGLGAIASDVDADGDLDLYVANDSTENRLWCNVGDGTFEDATLLSGTGVDRWGATQAGMGLAAGDVDGDGRIDLFVTNFDDESNTLYQNRGEGLFADRTAPSGLDGPSRLSVGFGCVLADLDHDADLDLVVANGHIIDNITLYHDGKSHAQRTLAFENDGRGRFREVGPAWGALAVEPLVGRGLYAGDLDGDQDLDLVLTQCGGGVRLYRNDLAAGRPALVLAGLPEGTRVEATLPAGEVEEPGGAPERVLVRETGVEVSYFGRGTPDLHLGVDPARLTALRLRLPGGPWLALEPPDAPGRFSVVLEADRARLRSP